jgi:hypothetical protein
MASSTAGVSLQTDVTARSQDSSAAGDTAKETLFISVESIEPEVRDLEENIVPDLAVIYDRANVIELLTRLAHFIGVIYQTFLDDHVRPTLNDAIARVSGLLIKFDGDHVEALRKRYSDGLEQAKKVFRAAIRSREKEAREDAVGYRQEKADLESAERTSYIAAAVQAIRLTGDYQMVGHIPPINFRALKYVRRTIVIVFGLAEYLINVLIFGNAENVWFGLIFGAILAVAIIVLTLKASDYGALMWGYWKRRGTFRRLFPGQSNDSFDDPQYGKISILEPGPKDMLLFVLCLVMLAFVTIGQFLYRVYEVRITPDLGSVFIILSVALVVAVIVGFIVKFEVSPNFPPHEYVKYSEANTAYQAVCHQLETLAGVMHPGDDFDRLKREYNERAQQLLDETQQPGREARQQVDHLRLIWNQAEAGYNQFMDRALQVVELFMRLAGSHQRQLPDDVASPDTVRDLMTPHLPPLAMPTVLERAERTTFDVIVSDDRLTDLDAEITSVIKDLDEEEAQARLAAERLAAEARLQNFEFRDRGLLRRKPLKGAA